MVFYGYIWLYMGIYGYIWVYMRAGGALIYLVYIYIYIDIPIYGAPYMGPYKWASSKGPNIWSPINGAPYMGTHMVRHILILPYMIPYMIHKSPVMNLRPFPLGSWYICSGVTFLMMRSRGLLF